MLKEEVFASIRVVIQDEQGMVIAFVSEKIFSSNLLMRLNLWWLWKLWFLH